MNLLFIVPYAPTRIRTRPHNLIRSLARRGHALTLATLWETEEERQFLDELADEGIRVLSVPLTRGRSALNVLGALVSARSVPLQAAYCWQPALARMIISQLATRHAPFDIIHVEHLRGAQYGLHLKSSLPNTRSAIPIVWDSVDCISLLFDQAARNSRSHFGRWVTRFELPRTRRYEGRLVRQFDRVLATSAADKAALEGLAEDCDAPPSMHAKPARDGTARRAERVQVVPNGVDLDYFSPNFGRSLRSTDTVVLTGKMSYHANVTAALHLVNDVMPHVWARRPDVRVEIVGHAPTREVRALASRYAERARRRVVLVTGHVPDMRPYLWSAAVAAAPIVYGAGNQNKVLEAMACAAPVVATPQAVSALSARAGEDLLVADGAQAFAREILRLLEDGALRRRVGEQGCCYVTTHHNWAAITVRLEDIYRELAFDRSIASTGAIEQSRKDGAA